MKLTKKILEQLIKEELSLIERKIIDPSPEMQQKLRDILQTAPSAWEPHRLETDIRIGYESQVPEAAKILDKIMGIDTGIMKDPCLKKQTTKNNFKKILSNLPKLSTKNLDYLENELAYFIENSQSSADEKELQFYIDQYYRNEEVARALESGRMDLLSKKDREDTEYLIKLKNDSVADVMKYLKKTQEDMVRTINDIKRELKEAACAKRVYTRVYETVSEINIQKAQAQSDKEQKIKIMSAIEYERGYVVKLSDGKVYNVPYEKVAEFKKEFGL